jgi:hypothetical protein
MFEIYADGILWIGPEGETEYSSYEADAMAASIERIGYEVEITEVS